MGSGAQSLGTGGPILDSQISTRFSNVSMELTFSNWIFLAVYHPSWALGDPVSGFLLGLGPNHNEACQVKPGLSLDTGLSGQSLLEPSFVHSQPHDRNTATIASLSISIECLTHAIFSCIFLRSLFQSRQWFHYFNYSLLQCCLIKIIQSTLWFMSRAMVVNYFWDLLWALLGAHCRSTNSPWGISEFFSDVCDNPVLWSFIFAGSNTHVKSQ